MEIIHEMNQTEMVFHQRAWKKGVTPFHWHERIEIIIPQNAPIGVLIDGVWYEAEPNDVIFIGEQRIHSFRIDQENTEILLGQFPYHILLGGGAVPPPLRPHIKADEIAAVGGLNAQLSRLLAMLLAEGRVAITEKNPLMQSLCAALYFLLARHFPAQQAARTDDKGKTEFYKIVSYVNGHFTEDITVGSVAKSLYADRGRLSRLFLRYAGMSLNSYINTLRIAKAAALIRGGAPITEAALEAGFQSVRTFHDVYRRTQNAAPRKLRN